MDAVFFAVLAAYLREERPGSCRAAECFVVLRGPTAGQPLTEAGLHRIFRTHRLASGALRVRPHGLRHTYVHLSPETLAWPDAGSNLNAPRVYQEGRLALRTC